MSDATSSPPRIKIAWLVGTAAAFALFALIGAYSSSMSWHYTDFDAQRAADRATTLAKLQEDENKLLTGPADWIDQTKGVIHIPVDEAIPLEIESLKSESPQVGCEIVGASAAPASTNAAPTAATPPSTNAATASPPAKKKP